MQKWGREGGRGGGATFLLLFSLFTFTECGESKVPFNTFQIFSLLCQPCKILIQVSAVLKPYIICTFLIHYGSLQEMFTDLFDFVWNTQKRKRKRLFLSAQARCSLLLKSFLYPLCPMWVQSGIFICPIIVLNLIISFNFCAGLGFNVFWFVKCMKIRKLEIEIISIQHNSFIYTIHC